MIQQATQRGTARASSTTPKRGYQFDPDEKLDRLTVRGLPAPDGQDGRLPDSDMIEVIRRAGVPLLAELSRRDLLAAMRAITGDHRDALDCANALERLTPTALAW